MSAVIYARKSSESEDRQVQSLDDQLGVLRSLARDEGIPVEVEYVESKSAKDPYARPEFERLIRSIEGGKVSHLLKAAKSAKSTFGHSIDFLEIQWMEVALPTSFRPAN